MALDHIAVANREEGEAERFYGGLVGLDRLYDFTIDAGLSERLFSVARDVRAVVFGDAGLNIEVFILPEVKARVNLLPHVCLVREDAAELARRAGGLGLEVLRIEREGRTLYFVKDFSGNPVEIKSEE